MTLDVFTLGEAMLRLSTPVGRSMATAPSYEVHVAGAEANVASLLAQLGRSVAWASSLPDSVLGRRVLAEMQAVGVDCEGVSLTDDARLGTYFVDIHPAPQPTTVVYDRAHSAVCSLTVDDIDWDLISQARVVHLSGITPALSESLGEVTSAIADSVADSETLLSFDVNYRAKLWAPKEARDRLSSFLELADLVVCGLQDAREVFGFGDSQADVAGRFAKEYSTPSLVITAGSAGAYWVHNGESGHVPAIPVNVIDRLGAGDAFTAGLIDGALDGHFVDGVVRGVALAAIALTTVGDQARVTRREVEALMAERIRDVDR